MRLATAARPPQVHRRWRLLHCMRQRTPPALRRCARAARLRPARSRRRCAKAQERWPREFGAWRQPRCNRAQRARACARADVAPPLSQHCGATVRAATPQRQFVPRRTRGPGRVAFWQVRGASKDLAGSMQPRRPTCTPQLDQPLAECAGVVGARDVVQGRHCRSAAAAAWSPSSASTKARSRRSSQASGSNTTSRCCTASKRGQSSALRWISLQIAQQTCQHVATTRGLQEQAQRCVEFAGQPLPMTVRHQALVERLTRQRLASERIDDHLALRHLQLDQEVARKGDRPRIEADLLRNFDVQQRQRDRDARAALPSTR